MLLPFRLNVLTDWLMIKDWITPTNVVFVKDGGVCHCATVRGTSDCASGWFASNWMLLQQTQ